MPKGKAKNGKRNLYIVRCEICTQEYSHTGMNGHIATHGLTVEQYVQDYGEYRQNVISRVSGSIKCSECMETFKSARQLTFHLRTVHKMTGEAYAAKHIFNNEPQFCKCGCGMPVQVLPRPPWRRDYLPGHNPNGMTGRLHTGSTKKILTEKSITRYSRTRKQFTKPELYFEELLKRLNIRYETQVATPEGVCDFYIPELDIFIEVDGEYWHPLKVETLNIQLLSSIINDYRKNLNIPNLIRIRSQDISSIRTQEDILLFDKKPIYPSTIESIYTKILSREYIKAKLEQDSTYFTPHLYLFLKIIRLFQPEFPNFESKEKIEDVIQVLPSKIATVYDKNTRTFNNNCSSIGNSALKSLFKSYWKSRYKAGKSPYEIWQDDNLISSIIRYRIGMNSRNEVYDFSLYNLIRGISAIRGTVSFFKPVLAGAIYHTFLQGKDAPVVLDPCAGFGGRMLGFKSVFPNGVYIGLEPNRDTYQELEHLKQICRYGDSVTLLNIKFEDYKQYAIDFDLVFTSTPYYDLEIYSNVVEYENEQKWAAVFLSEFQKYRNVLINLPLSLERYFPNISERYLISHNASHLSKKKTKQEVLLKL